MKKLLHNIKLGHLFVLGLIILLVSQLPMLFLGTDSIVPYHDQLDGEIIAYIYQAKYLFSGADTIPEFLNGAGKTTLTPPAPLAVLLFCYLSPFTAYIILQILGQLVAYVGTFLLINIFCKNKYITLIVSVLFTFLPFLPVYGLSQYGIPLLLFCLWNLYNSKKLIPSFLYVAFYASMSSLVLCGFVWIGIGFVIGIYFLFTKQFEKHFCLIAAFGLMLLIYILENLPLLEQLIGLGNSFVSHKEDYVLTDAPFFSQFISYFTESIEHAPDNHKWITFLAFGTIVFFLLTYKSASKESRDLFKWLLIDLLIICVFCAIAALWTTPGIVTLRQNMGVLKSIQISRILWLTPALWYIALALCILLLWSGKSFVRFISYIFSLVMLGTLGITCLKTSFVKPCLQELLLPEYETISWSDYYALGVMEQVENFIYKKDNLHLEEYKVASLGIDPAAALYHGFYCVDGYSNNYDIGYKCTFREVIAPELDKSDWLTAYYDDWGNRCYLFAAEIPGYYNIEKGTFWYNTLELNTTALKQLGCDYILSAAYIVTAEEMNLTLMQEEAFETADSYYRIYVYKINS